MSLTVLAPSVTAVTQSDPLSGAPEILITIESAEIFNLVGAEDASFETGTGTASPAGCTISSSTDEALDGTHSLRMVCTAAGAADTIMGVELGPYDVKGGTTYTLMVNALDSFYGGTELSLIGLFFDHVGTFVGTTSGATQTLSNHWADSYPVVSGVAPADGTLKAHITVASPNGPLDVPVITGVLHGATGTAIHSYRVTAFDNVGETLGSNTITISDGVPLASMNGSNYNALAWSSISGALGYLIYRADTSAPTCATIAENFVTCADVATSFATCADVAAYAAPAIFYKIGEASPGSDTSFNDEGGSLTPLTPIPSEDTSGERVYLDEFGVFPGDYSGPWFITPEGTITVQRDDGDYVLGASPMFPLALDASGTAAVVVDLDAPYGLPVSYVATLTVTGVGNSPPSMPSAPVVMGQAPDTIELYHRLGWAQEQDLTGVLLRWLSGIGQMLQGLDSLTRDSYDLDGDVAPGWSQVLDINRAPSVALPWLGQFVGARFSTTLRDDQQRYIIEHAPGWARGTPAAILAAADMYLLPGFEATLLERDTSPYHLTIDIPTAGVRGDATCRSIALGFATCADLAAAFATCADVWATTAEIEAAVLAAIPAGLVAELTFV